MSNEDVDNHFLQSLFKAHSKTSIAFLHLKTGTLPIRFILISRRLNYLHNILVRSEKELVLRVFRAQQSKPAKGDWIKLIEKDLNIIGETLDETKIKSMSKNMFKLFVKNKVHKSEPNQRNAIQSETFELCRTKCPGILDLWQIRKHRD